MARVPLTPRARTAAYAGRNASSSAAIDHVAAATVAEPLQRGLRHGQHQLGHDGGAARGDDGGGVAVEEGRPQRVREREPDDQSEQ